MSYNDDGRLTTDKSKSHRRETAVDVVRAARNEAAALGDSSSSVVPNSSSGSPNRAIGVCRMILSTRVAVENFSILLCRKEPGTNRIDPHSERSQFAGRVLREIQYRRFRGRVGKDPRQRRWHVTLPEIDDRAAAVPRHVLAEHLRAEVHAGKVDVEDFLPVSSLISK